MTCVKIRPHPHIASMIGVSERTEPEEMYIVSEFCHGGTLFELLHESKVPVNWATKVSIAKQIAKGMLFLHSNQPPTIHRDLKSLK
jgi:serine/threonine protein kinase